MPTEGAKEVFSRAKNVILKELHGKYGVPRIDPKMLEPLEERVVGYGRFAEVFEVSLVRDDDSRMAATDTSVTIPLMTLSRPFDIRYFQISQSHNAFIAGRVAVKVMKEDKIGELLTPPPFASASSNGPGMKQDELEEKVKKSVTKLLEYYKRECVVWQKCSGDPKKAREKNIVELLGIAETYQESYLPVFVSRFISEGTIGSYIEHRTKSRLSDKHRILIVSDIANALKFLHAIGIVHRDIKARNILIENAGERYVGLLGDFGSSKMLEGDFLHNMSSTMSQDRWAPPEYLLELGAQHKEKGSGDIWALGCTFLEILQEEEPWKPYLPEIYKPMLCKYQYPMTGESVQSNKSMTFRHVDDRCYEVMKNCWSREKTDRISAADLYLELLKLAKSV
ncbi:hypothetical protein ACEPAI_4312 [Sanghuangporus weigelae]